MVRYCSAFGCNNMWKPDSTLSWHKFPKEKEICRKWVNKMKRENFEPTEASVLCSDHFTKDCFYTRGQENSKIRLRSGSIPTIFSFSDSIQPDNINKEHREIQYINKINVNERLEDSVNVKETLENSNVLINNESRYKNSENSIQKRNELQIQKICNLSLIEHDYAIKVSPCKMKRKLDAANERCDHYKRELKKCKARLAAAKDEIRTLSEILEIVKDNFLLTADE
ncbi:THAP domain-containing protein 1-like [Centruroides vittatus]|uniref:THAP domain-containing protein 1-like n=1 Tax=Centruroides vittatus TaxID=120091 RepID=UPI00350EB0F2